ncbi:hypothetical protein SCG7109_AK_00270 [Chlamydiales bacterium SCGC AG-110-M15]|nr:hypothetical protein SCG7109_AK_00270 [Chlamydiales bacterium SCGC AG-110-M15]
MPRKQAATKPKKARSPSKTPKKTTLKTKAPTRKLTSSPITRKKTKPPHTRVIIKCNCGFSNDLYIRGNGGTLSWDKGQKLKNIKADEWLWESDQDFPACEFKVLINDMVYECGENHALSSGSSLRYTPNFE